jgi:tRNA threonylcarbamoyl adenosine modification protein YeaZ
VNRRLLALETAGERASAALLDWPEDGEARLVDERSIAAPQDHGRKLVPMIADLCRQAAVPPASLAAVAVGRGPGSYTGLRVGIATALGLAVAASIPVYGVESLRAAAWTVRASAPGPCAVVADAGRGGLYVQAFEAFGRAAPALLGDATRVDGGALGDFLAGLRPSHVLAVGPDAGRALVRGPWQVNRQPFLGAFAVGGLAVALVKEGVSRHEQALAVAPIYLRPAAAAAGV